MYLSKVPVLSFQIVWGNYGKSLGAMVSVFAVDASFRALAPNPGDAADIICSSINIFLVIFHLMCSKNLTVQN